MCKYNESPSLSLPRDQSAGTSQREQSKSPPGWAMMANGPMQCIVTPHYRSRPGHERDRSGKAKKKIAGQSTRRPTLAVARTTRYSRPAPCHPTRGAGPRGGGTVTPTRVGAARSVCSRPCLGGRNSVDGGRVLCLRTVTVGIWLFMAETPSRSVHAAKCRDKWHGRTWPSHQWPEHIPGGVMCRC
jgi:hypothetical protein